MADIDLIIKIDEGIYNEVCWRGLALCARDHVNIEKAIKNGTVLSKGHGRLIDADELKKEYPHDTDWDYPVNTNCYVVESIDNSPTIIEAESDGKE